VKCAFDTRLSFKTETDQLGAIAKIEKKVDLILFLSSTRTTWMVALLLIKEIRLKVTIIGKTVIMKKQLQKMMKILRELRE